MTQIQGKISEEKPRERDLTIDAIRGFAIFLVVLGHSIQYNLPDPFSNAFFRVIYSFHMPLFMFISGYLAWNHINNKNVDYLGKKFVNLVIPFISWYCIGYGILFITSLISSGIFTNTIRFEGYILDMINLPDWALWFLWILFLNFVILFIVLKFEKILGDFAILSAIILLYALEFLRINNTHIQFLQWYFPIFSLAYLIAKYQKKVRQWELAVTLVAAISFPVLVIFWQFNATPTFIPELQMHFFLLSNRIILFIIILIYKYITAFSGIVVAIALIRMIKPLKNIYNFLSWLGRYTLDIYVSSGIFLGFLIIGFTQLHVNFLPLKIVLCTIFSLTLSLGLSFLILRKSKILSFLFLGKGW